MKLLSGDTLFIGDVGRPDLAGSKGLTAEEMAGMLYDSLRDKIMAVPIASKCIRRTARVPCAVAISRKIPSRPLVHRSNLITRYSPCRGRISFP